MLARNPLPLALALLLLGLASCRAAPPPPARLGSLFVQRPGGLSMRAMPAWRLQDGLGRLVQLDLAPLARSRGRAQLDIEVEPGRFVTFTLEPFPSPSPETRAWHGFARDPDGGGTWTIDAVLRAQDRDRVFLADAHAPNGDLYILRPRPGSYLWQRIVLDWRSFVCGTDLRRAGTDDSGEDPPEDPADDDSDFDVLVLYTPDAREKEGGELPMLAYIDLAVVETNVAYANSKIVERVSLAGTAEVEYEELTSFDDMLDDLTDGDVPAAHDLRALHHADLVSLLVLCSTKNGVAWRMDVADPAFADKAFSVVSTLTATGHFSFGHELGHNQGCGHEPDESDPGLPAHAHGWDYYRAGYWRRTVLATTGGTREQQLSNPDVSFGGFGATGKSDVANNALRIHETAPIVAGFGRSPAP